MVLFSQSQKASDGCGSLPLAGNGLHSTWQVLVSHFRSTRQNRRSSPLASLSKSKGSSPKYLWRQPWLNRILISDLLWVKQGLDQGLASYCSTPLTLILSLYSLGSFFFFFWFKMYKHEYTVYMFKAAFVASWSVLRSTGRKYMLHAHQNEM